MPADQWGRALAGGRSTRFYRPGAARSNHITGRQPFWPPHRRLPPVRPAESGPIRLGSQLSDWQPGRPGDGRRARLKPPRRKPLHRQRPNAGSVSGFPTSRPLTSACHLVATARPASNPRPPERWGIRRLSPSPCRMLSLCNGPADQRSACARVGVTPRMLLVAGCAAGPRRLSESAPSAEFMWGGSVRLGTTLAGAPSAAPARALRSGPSPPSAQWPPRGNGPECPTVGGLGVSWWDPARNRESFPPTSTASPARART